jgi:hypothetical protein
LIGGAIGAVVGSEVRCLIRHGRFCD